MSKNQKTVQIQIDTFLEIIEYLKNPDPDEITKSELIGVLEKKYDAMVRREIFSKYKNAAPGTVDREKFRNLYLENAEIRKNFKTTKEIPEKDFPF
jgi:hypothetical protein